MQDACIVTRSSGKDRDLVETGAFFNDINTTVRTCFESNNGRISTFSGQKLVGGGDVLIKGCLE